MSDNSGLRPLYLVDEIAKAVGEEITYVYDDLVFISHSEGLIQFSDSDDTVLKLFLHRDLDAKTFGSLKAKYAIVAKQQEKTLLYAGRFEMTPKEGSDEIDLNFFPETAEAP